MKQLKRRGNELKNIKLLGTIAIGKAPDEFQFSF